MNKILVVAVREFVETVRTKAFVLSVVLMPGLVVAGIYGSNTVGELSKSEQVPLRKILVLSDQPSLVSALSARIGQYNKDNANRPLEVVDAGKADALPTTASAPHEQTPTSAPQSAFAIAKRRAENAVQNGDAYAYVVVPDEAISGEAKVILSRRDQGVEFGRRLHEMISEAIVDVRFAAHQPPISRAAVQALQREVQLETVDPMTGLPVGGGEIARLLTPFAFMFLMTIGIFQISQGLLTSVMEEKSTRVIEVLLSAVSPTQLMAGKILGMTVVGLVLLMVWGASGYYAANKAGMGNIVSGSRLLFVALYFLPGFLMASSLLAAIGAACNELKEAQSMAFPISLINLVPMIFWFYITENPSSIVSVVLSFIPPITPLIMILRICADPQTPVWQIVATLVVLWIGVVITMWAAGKVFRVGVLMYGKPPSVRELMRWVRYT